MSVTLYRHNKVDEAVEEDGTSLALQFVQACKDRSYQRGGRLNVEFEYRWWLSGPDGKQSTWDEEDWPALWVPLTDLLNSDLGSKEAVLKMCDPHSAD